MRPHLQMDYYVRTTRRSSSTTLTTIVKESPGIETFSYVSSNVTIIRHYRAGGWVQNISIDHSSNKSEMSRGGRQPLLITQIHSRNTVEDVFEKYSWEIQWRNTVEKYGAPQLLITVSIGRRKTLWGARYLFAARPHTGEYSEYQIQQYIFLLRYWNIFSNCLRVHWRRGMWFGPVWQQSKIWDMQLLLSTTHSRWEIHLGNTEKYIWVMQFNSNLGSQRRGHFSIPQKMQYNNTRILRAQPRDQAHKYLQNNGMNNTGLQFD